MSKLLIEKNETKKTEWKNNLVEIIPKLMIERDEMNDETQIAAFDKVIDSLLFFIQNFPAK